MSNETYRRFDPWRTAPVEEESRTRLIRSHYFNVDHVTFTSSESGEFERDVLTEAHGDTVGILAITDDHSIPFIEQYRVPTHRWTLEIPCGHAQDSHEQPKDVAIRKLRDEVGYQAESLTQFTRFINTPSCSTQHTVLFYAQGLSPVPHGDIGPESPRFDIRHFTVDEAYRLVVNGTILDAKSVIAVLRLKAGIFIPDYSGANEREQA